MNLLKQVKISVNNFTSASATTDVETAIYDMQGFDGIVAMTHFATTGSGTVGSASGNGLFARISTASSSGTEQASGSFIPGVTTAQALEIHRPTQRYVQFGLKRSGAGTKAGSIFVLQYAAGRLPTTNATTITTKILATPATGTI